MPGPVHDSDLPAVEALLGPDAAAALEPAIGGGKIVQIRPDFVNYTPGEDIVVTYDTTVKRSKSTYDEKLVAVARHRPPPEGTIDSEAGGMHIGVWRYPHDPSLPGLPLVAHDLVAELLEEVGLQSTDFTIRALGYSPRSRAVFEVAARPPDKLVFRPGVGLAKPKRKPLMYLKVRRPSRARDVKRAHELLAGRLRAPRVLAHRDDLGILALEPIAGDPLWDCLVQGKYEPPDPEQLIGLLESIEDVEMEQSRRDTTSETVRWNGRVLQAVAPERADVIERFLESFGEDPPQPEVTVHGDFHEVQVLVDPDGVSGVLDLDDAGRGERVDDLAMMAGRMYQYSHSDPDRGGRAVAYTERIMDVFAEHAGREDFMRRVAGVALNHAANPFRYQDSGWPSRTREHIDRALALFARAAPR